MYNLSPDVDPWLKKKKKSRPGSSAFMMFLNYALGPYWHL